MPEISVIIPTYQHGDTIAACLDSVFGQTFKDIEVIVVNDGSTDDTDEMIKPYLDRILYKKIPNAGAPKARNTGFAIAKGRFVIFCDADLLLKPEMLQILYEALKAHPQAAYAYGGFRFGLGQFKGLTWSESRLKKLNYIHTSALIRREAFVGFDETIKKFQDWDLWLTLLEKGRRGVAVNKILFSAKPRKAGMSWWLPKGLYSPFFKAIGLRFKAVVRYDEAAKIIAKKHGLDLTPTVNDGGKLWLGFIAIFALSVLAFAYPWLGTIVSLVFLAFILVATLNNLVYGVGAILAELILGSLAGRTLALDLFGHVLSFRIALFALVGAVWLIRLAQRRIRLPQKNLLLAVVVLLAVVGWGIMNGLLHGLAFKDVFSNANAYFALPLILIFVSAVKDERDQAWLKKILKHGVIALSLVTIVALYFFSHKFMNAAGVFIYKWLRDSRIAEVTALDNGVYRIFIQSQLFCLLAFIMVALRGRPPYQGEEGAVPVFKNWAWGILPTAALLISASRSFALGLGTAGLIYVILLFISSSRVKRGISTSQNKLRDSSPWIDRQNGLGMTIGKIAIFAVCGVAIFVLALKFPFPPERSQKSFEAMLLSKNVSQRDAAVASRWSLIKELNAKIMEAPFFGSGFGTTVTYLSSDPRIISTTGGSYTTSAFEWNYHDILVKMGIIGLIAYGYLLVIIFLALWRAEERERRWLIPAFVALIVLNAVSPFLNHPLGIGYLALLAALAESKRGDAAPIAIAELLKKPAPAPAMSAAPGLAMVNEE